MRPYFINLINAFVLITLGSWAYISSDTPSVTAMIPVIAGVILLLITPGFKKGNRILSHLAVAFTFLILAGLIKPLTGAIGRCDSLGIARVSVMIISSLLALIVFIRSFINARRGSEK